MNYIIHFEQKYGFTTNVFIQLCWSCINEHFTESKSNEKGFSFCLFECKNTQSFLQNEKMNTFHMQERPSIDHLEVFFLRNLNVNSKDIT